MLETLYIGTDSLTRGRVCSSDGIFGVQVLSILGYGGEMVYWFFDHFLWLSKVGVLDAKLADRMSYISSFGEGFSYIFFITADLIVIRRGVRAEALWAKQVAELREMEALGLEPPGEPVAKQASCPDAKLL